MSTQLRGIRGENARSVWARPAVTFGSVHWLVLRVSRVRRQRLRRMLGIRAA